MSRVSYTPIQMEAPITAPKHLVTMEWVEDFVVGKIKAPVRVVSTANLYGTYAPGVAPAPVTKGSITMGATGALVIDGVTLNVGDRLLLVGQTNAIENGIYVIMVAGNASTAAVIQRSDDFDRDEQIFTGVRISVVEGSLFAKTIWSLVTGGTIVLDSTALEFTQVANATGAEKIAATITGDSVATLFEIEHDLGTTDVQVKVFSLNTNSEVITDVTTIDNDTVSIGFAVAPTPAQSFRVIVIG